MPLQRFPRPHWAGGSTYVEENIKPHLLRNIWTPSIEKYLNHSESKFGSLYVLNVWTNLGPSTVLYFFQNQFEPTLASSFHVCGKSWKPSTRLKKHHGKADGFPSPVAGTTSCQYGCTPGEIRKSPGILLDSDHSQYATKVGFGWWMIGEWPPNESAKSYHVISRLPIKNMPQKMVTFYHHLLSWYPHVSWFFTHTSMIQWWWWIIFIGFPQGKSTSFWKRFPGRGNPHLFSATRNGACP